MLCFYIYFWICKSEDYIDKHGTTFEDKDFRVLKKGKSDLEIYEIPNKTVIIKSGTENNNAFGECVNLNSITFPEGSQLEIIGDYAFYGLKKLKRVSVRNCTKLKTIGNFCFYSCINLLGFEVSNSIETIGTKSFEASGLTSFVYPINTKKASYRSFACQSLRTLIFPSECTINLMSAESFPNTLISTVTIPESVTAMYNAFVGSELKSIYVHENNTKYWSDGKAVYTKDNTTIIMVVRYCGDYRIPDSIHSMDNMAMRSIRPISIQFNNKLSKITYFGLSGTNLTSITCPPSITSLLQDAFSYSHSLTYIKFEGQIITIPHFAFQNCEKLETVILSKTLKTIGQQAFFGCSALKELFIPKSVDNILSGAFLGMRKDVNITFEEGSPIFLDGDYLYNSKRTLLIAYIGSGNADVRLLDSTEEIGIGVFRGMNLKSVEIPLSLQRISEQAFKGAKISTKSVSLGNVAYVGEEAFAGAEVASVELGARLKRIGARAFAETSLSSVTIPESVTTISDGAFASTRRLTLITLEGGSLLEEIGDSAFEGSAIRSFEFTPGICRIGVSSFARSGIETLVFVSNGKLKEINSTSFSKCQNLTDVNFGNVEIIGENGFEGCGGLTRVTLTRSVTSILPRAFRSCANLESVKVAQGSALANLSALAFEGCIRLRSFEIPGDNGNFETEDGVVYNRDKTRILVFPPGLNKTVFEVPAGILEIGAYSCFSSSFLEEVHLSSSVEVIGYEAFRGSKLLKLVALSEGLREVHNRAFEECASMRCDSVIFRSPEQKSFFTADTGISSEAVEHCPTALFTAGGREGREGLSTVSMTFCTLGEVQE